MAASIACPACDEPIGLSGQPDLGQRLRCTHCGTELEVIATDPVELDWVDFEPDEEAWEEDSNSPD